MGHHAPMDLAARYAELEERIASACQQAGRKRESVHWIAVSKTFSAEAILELYQLGHRVFGESRLQEAQQKTKILPADIEWHFVGGLQSNKARKIGNSFAMIHTLASESALTELAKCEHKVPVLIEVNIAKEPQKSGILPEALDTMIKACLKCQQVQLKGLMTIGPNSETPEESRPWFQQMRMLRDQHLPGGFLSMGMSADFDVAIQEGATHIRIGSLLFGERL